MDTSLVCPITVSQISYSQLMVTDTAKPKAFLI
jgi:hypothetical protein